MVDSVQHDHPRPAWLAAKMVVYAAAFLAFILVLVPSLFHRLGQWLFAPWVHEAFAPGFFQKGLGIVVFVVGLGGYLFCSFWLVVVGRGPFVEFDPPTRFVASGPYRWTRNPIAALLIVAVLGESLYFGSPGIFLLVLWGLHLAQLQVVCIEEPRLRTRFGEEYVEYCRRVPRWLPRRPGTPSGHMDSGGQPGIPPSTETTHRT